MKEIVKELIKELNEGKVRVNTSDGGEFTFFVEASFNIQDKYIGNDKDIPMIYITNYNNLINNLNEYVDVAKEFYKDDKEYFDLSNKGFIKKLVLDLMINCSREDLYDFNNYVKKRIKLLNDNTISLINERIGVINGCSLNLEINKNFSNLEGPYKASFYLERDNERFYLPAICFGIDKSKSYIYSIQSKQIDKSIGLVKEYDRYFRKVNKGIDKDIDIYNVSPNALISLTLFNSYMYKKGIKELEVIPFMPLRYYGNMKAFFKKNKDIEDVEEKYDYIQSNITNKFLNLISRYAYHFNLDYDFNDSDIMYLYLDENNINGNDNIIYDIYKCVGKTNKR